MAKDAYVRIVATLKEDAIATPSAKKGYEVALLLRIPRRMGSTNEEVIFVAKESSADTLRDLVGQLKKDKTVELVTTLGANQLVAKYVRVDRVDYPVKADIPLLPVASS